MSPGRNVSRRDSRDERSPAARKGPSYCQWAAILASLGLVALGVGWFAVRHSRTRARRRRIPVEPTSLGDISVSPRAVEQMARRLAMGVSGVKKIKTRVERVSGGMAVRARLQVTDGCDLKRVIPRVRGRLGQAVSRLVGIPVKEVSLAVEGLDREAVPYQVDGKD